MSAEAGSAVAEFKDGLGYGGDANQADPEAAEFEQFLHGLRLTLEANSERQPCKF